MSSGLTPNQVILVNGLRIGGPMSQVKLMEYLGFPYNNGNRVSIKYSLQSLKKKNRVLVEQGIWSLCPKESLIDSPCKAGESG